MSYTLNLGLWNQIFAVPVAVVDKYIKLASEGQLKVLLYLLRHAGEELNDDILATALNISTEEAKNALLFWEERDLITVIGNQLTPSKTVPSINSESVVSIEEETAKTKKDNKPHTTVSRVQKPDSAFVAKLLKEDKFLSALLEDAQIILKKPLSSGDTATIVMLYHTCGLPCEVIALMMTYLSSVGEANMHSIERMGIRWADEGIITELDAESEIERMTNSRKAWGKICDLFGIRSIGKPTNAQIEHANRWINEWGFSDEMLLEAYERCVNTKGEYNIRYINAILQRWHAKGIKSLDALRADESSVKPKRKRRNKESKGSMFSLEDASFDVEEPDSIFDD